MFATPGKNFFVKPNIGEIEWNAISPKTGNKFTSREGYSIKPFSKLKSFREVK